MEKVIKIENLRKVYKNSIVVQNASFEPDSGSTVGLSGLDGTGKNLQM